jgi:hypothetical protein
MNAAGHQVVQRRSTKHIEMPERANASRMSRLKVDSAPKASVNGAKTIPSNGIAVLFMRFTPCG